MCKKQQQQQQKQQKIQHAGSADQTYLCCEPQRCASTSLKVLGNDRLMLGRAEDPGATRSSRNNDKRAMTAFQMFSFDGCFPLMQVVMKGGDRTGFPIPAAWVGRWVG
jgi:hypothetical protein